MLTVLDHVYLKLRREEIMQAENILKRIKTDNVLQSINKNCWEYGIIDEVKMKNKEILLIKISDKKKTVLLKYHKKDAVSWEEFEKFMLSVQIYEAGKGVYITTGLFDSKIKEYCSQSAAGKNVQIVDKFRLIQNHIGLVGKASQRISKDKLCVMKYIPV